MPMEREIISVGGFHTLLWTFSGALSVNDDPVIIGKYEVVETCHPNGRRQGESCACHFSANLQVYSGKKYQKLLKKWEFMRHFFQVWLKILKSLKNQKFSGKLLNYSQLQCSARDEADL